MTLPVQQFPILTPDMYSGLGNAVKNYQQSQMSAAQIQQQQLANQLTQVKLKYADPEEKAALAQAQALPGLTNAQMQAALGQANLSNQNAKWVGPQAQAYAAAQYGQANQANAGARYTGAQQNLLQQQTPALVQQQQEKLFSDPIIQRQYQLQLAMQQNPQLSQQLQNLGIAPNQGAQQAPQAPQQAGPYAGIAQGLQQMFGGGQTSPSTTPNAYGGNSAQNFALFGSPLDPGQMQQYLSAGKTAGSTGVTNYNEALKSANDAAQDATQMKQFHSQFEDAYNKSTYKGPTLGSTPSTGPTTALVPGDLSNEQRADNAAQNMQALMTKLMNFKRLTNYELNFTGGLKLNRSMAPAAVDQIGNFLDAKTQRLQELPQFLTAAKNSGIDAQTAQVLYNMYDNQKPVFNFQRNKTNSANTNGWKDYLSSDAVNAVKNGQPYVPNVNKMSRSQIDQLSPQTRAMAVQMMGNQ